MAPMPVYMIYPGARPKIGVTVMRTLQLAQISNLFLSHLYEFIPVPMPHPREGNHLDAVRPLTGGIVVLGKRAMPQLEDDAFGYLKQHNHAVLGDWVDRAFSRKAIRDGIDIHIAASHAFRDHVAEQAPELRVRLLTHHADPRLAAQDFVPLDRLSILYLGHMRFLSGAEGIADRLTVEQVRGDKEFREVLPRLPGFNAHYNVRPVDEEARDSGVFKPFTKGFTAAACHANILLQREVHDAETYLGADYPYFVTDDSPDSVLAGLDHLAASFGGPDWRHGLEVMADVARRSAPQWVAREFAAILDEARTL